MEDRHITRSPHELTGLSMKLGAIEILDGRNADDYMDNLTTAFSDLETAGAGLGEYQKVAALMVSFPASIQHLGRQVAWLNEGKFTYREACDLLRRHLAF